MMKENGMAYPTTKQSWGIVGIAIVFMILFSPVNLALNSFAGKELSFLIYYLLAIGATFWFAHLKRVKWTGVDEYNFQIGSIKIGILVSVAVIAIQIGIVSPITSAIPIPESLESIFLALAKQNGIFSFITIVIAAPILEELIFRGIMLDGLLKIYSPLKAILISSLLFGVIHLNPWQFVAAFVIGIFSGWVYYKTQKLTLCILIHFSNNLFAFGSGYFMDPESILDKSLTELYGGFFNLMAITFGAILVASICLHFLRVEIKNMEKCSPSEKQPTTT